MTDLPRRTLGKTQLDVTTLAYGAMELRGPIRGPKITDEEAELVLNTVLDSGINFIDTSIDYGLSEERIGKFIAHRRDEFMLASKCGCVPGEKQGHDHVHTAANIRAGVEHSLSMMKTDHLDLVQVHRSLEPQAFDEQGALTEALKLKDEGKVRFIGASGILPNLSDQIDMGVFDTFQIPYSAVQRDHEKVIEKASEAGAGIIIRGGAARGAPTDWETRNSSMVSGTQMRDIWERAEIDAILEGMSRMEFTLRFTLSNPHLDATIVGTRSIEHLEQNIGFARQGPLSVDLYEEAKRRLDKAGSRPIS